LASQRDPSEDGKDLMIGDIALRYALARTRSDKAEIEDNRAFRMNKLRVKADVLPEPASVPALKVVQWSPTSFMVHRKGMKTNGDPIQQWPVDPALAQAMRGDNPVDLPFTLVQHARHKSSIP